MYLCYSLQVYTVKSSVFSSGSVGLQMDLIQIDPFEHIFESLLAKTLETTRQSAVTDLTCEKNLFTDLTDAFDLIIEVSPS